MQTVTFGWYCSFRLKKISPIVTAIENANHQPMTPIDLAKKQVDDAAVKNYFDNTSGGTAATISMMAHEHQLPESAAEYRFNKELKTTRDWFNEVPDSGRVLDVGCGAGSWTEIFAKRYKVVIGIEQSTLMYKAAKERLAHMSNVEILEGDGRDDLPEGNFDMIFLGGLCMYLNDKDVVTLLHALSERLNKDGVIILRESTVHQGEFISKGEYQAVYRNVNQYHQLFNEAGSFHIQTRRNFGYTNLVTAEELVNLRRMWVPFLPKDSTILGSLTWWALRATTPLSFWVLPRMLSKLGIQWAQPTKSFFQVSCEVTGSKSPNQRQQSISVHKQKRHKSTSHPISLFEWTIHSSQPIQVSAHTVVLKNWSG